MAQRAEHHSILKGYSHSYSPMEDADMILMQYANPDMTFEHVESSTNEYVQAWARNKRLTCGVCENDYVIYETDKLVDSFNSYTEWHDPRVFVVQPPTFWDFGKLLSTCPHCRASNWFHYSPMYLQAGMAFSIFMVLLMVSSVILPALT